MKFISTFHKGSHLLNKYYNIRDKSFNGFKFARREISMPLIALLKTEKDCETIQLYCEFIEEMWNKGDDIVQNIVDVQIIEDVSEHENIWFVYGKYVSDEFKEYINTYALPYNVLLTETAKLP